MHTHLRNRPPLLAAVTALAVAGLVAAPVPAHALPPAPLAPANCQQWAFNGFTTLHVAANVDFDFQFTSNEPSVNGTVTRVGADESGTITGGIDKNGHVELAIPEGGTALRFMGDVTNDGKARGTWSGNPPTARWETTAPLKCIDTTPQGANSQMATVLKDSDVYDTPEGNRLRRRSSCRRTVSTRASNPALTTGVCSTFPSCPAVHTVACPPGKPGHTRAKASSTSSRLLNPVGA